MIDGKSKEMHIQLLLPMYMTCTSPLCFLLLHTGPAPSLLSAVWQRVSGRKKGRTILARLLLIPDLNEQRQHVKSKRGECQIAPSWSSFCPQTQHGGHKDGPMNPAALCPDPAEGQPQRVPGAEGSPCLYRISPCLTKVKVVSKEAF